jgi:tetrachlorobenzoquinone reductase
VTLPATLTVRVRAMTYEAQGIVGLELVPLAPATSLPAFSAGAHIDLHLPTPGGEMIRSYSLLNDPVETHRYRIGVNLDAKSRGGSAYLHQSLRAGDIITIGAPRNNFPLDESSPHNVFIAGGIGITPMLGMIARSQALGTPWTLYYSARTRAHAGFLDWIESEAGRAGGQVVLNFDQEPGGRMLNLGAVVSSMPAGAHVYCCGPIPMLEAYENATSSLPPGRVHKEYFAAKDAPATAGGFTVELARSHKTLQVPAGKTILDCLIEIHAEPPYSCREGVCGTCEVKVLEGIPDHRDLVLSDSERAANDRMMVCCSGSCGSKLVLDL